MTHDHRGLEPSVNRLVLGMLASALFLGSSLMVSLGETTCLPRRSAQKERFCWTERPLAALSSQLTIRRVAMRSTNIMVRAVEPLLSPRRRMPLARARSTIGAPWSSLMAGETPAWSRATSIGWRRSS